jgi:hypothetical protein
MPVADGHCGISGDGISGYHNTSHTASASISRHQPASAVISHARHRAMLGIDLGRRTHDTTHASHTHTRVSMVLWWVSDWEGAAAGLVVRVAHSGSEWGSASHMVRVLLCSSSSSSFAGTVAASPVCLTLCDEHILSVALSLSAWQRSVLTRVCACVCDRRSHACMRMHALWHSVHAMVAATTTNTHLVVISAAAAAASSSACCISRCSAADARCALRVARSSE